MTSPELHDKATVVTIILQVIFGYLIFALTASSVSMWLVSYHMQAAIRGYAMSVTFLMAAGVIYYYTSVWDLIALGCAAVAVLGPLIYRVVISQKS